MRRYKAFTIINLSGLAFAMSICMLIILMIGDQLRYDKFQKNRERIYRIISAKTYATSPSPLAAALKNEYPIVEDATNLTPGFGGDALYETTSTEMRGYFTDPSFFKVLEFDLEHGRKETALADANSIVISKEIATLLFKGKDPIGKVIEFNDRNLPFPLRSYGGGSASVPWGSFTVTGVFDADKYKSHLTFDVLASSATLPRLHEEKKFENRTESWDAYWRTYTFVLLREGVSESELDKALGDLVARKYKDLNFDHLKDFGLGTQALSEIQFDLKGNDTNHRMPGMIYYFFCGLALIIMLSACLNYTSLTIARALTRAKEIGVRKVTGANNRSLIFQFLSESVLTALLALAAALIILLALKPAFLSLWINRHLNFDLPLTSTVFFAFLVFALVIGIIAGLYPALRLSGIKPVRALKALSDSKTGKLKLFKVLSVGQFVTSLFFITTSILIFNQFRHYIHFDYGFNAKNIVNIELQGIELSRAANLFSGIKQVSLVSGCDVIPATGTNNGNQFKNSGEDDSKYRFFSVIHTDENFIRNLELEMIAGTDFSGVSPPENVVLNEAAAEALGFGNAREAIGHVIESKYGNEQLTVVGVLSDFSYMLPINQHTIGGLVLRQNTQLCKYLNVRISSDTPGALLALEREWMKLDPTHPLRFEFFEDELSNTHQAILDIVSILGIIAFLSVLISCLGMLGMTTYTAERKRKEVGIRKILGAGIARIAIQLSSGFLKVLAISVVIGAPLSYLVNQMWLQRLPNRVDFGMGTILIGTFVLLVPGVLTIGSQIYRAAISNPVDAIKSE